MMIYLPVAGGIAPPVTLGVPVPAPTVPFVFAVAPALRPAPPASISSSALPDAPQVRHYDEQGSLPDEVAWRKAL